MLSAPAAQAQPGSILAKDTGELKWRRVRCEVRFAFYILLRHKTTQTSVTNLHAVIPVIETRDDCKKGCCSVVLFLRLGSESLGVGG